MNNLKDKFNHDLQEYDLMEKQWARVQYKLESHYNDVGPKQRTDYYEYLGEDKSDDWLVKYIMQYLKEDSDINLLCAHSCRSYDSYTGYTIFEPGKDLTVVFQYDPFGGDLRSINRRLSVQLHEPACHNRKVSPNYSNYLSHCDNDECPCYRLDNGYTIFCGDENLGCLKRLSNFVHVDN